MWAATASTPADSVGKTQLANRVDTVGDHYASSTSSGWAPSTPRAVARSRSPIRIRTVASSSRLRKLTTAGVFGLLGRESGSGQPISWTGSTKYVVAQVVQSDLTGGAPDEVTTYDYSQGTPAWHFSNDEGLTKDKYKTWGDWHGIQQGQCDHRGQRADPLRVDHLYYQGMNGDLSDPADVSKTKSVT